MKKIVNGFSKLTKREKIEWLVEHYFDDNEAVKEEFKAYNHRDEKVQKILDDFSENTLCNYYMPFGVAPNFKVNDKVFALPMVIEESSVVAAASNSAKFWLNRGGFKAEVISTVKVGQVHFKFPGDHEKLKAIFPDIKKQLIQGGKYLSVNMDARGGGVLDIDLVDFSDQEENLFQLKVSFETCDSMGANFINTILEEYAASLPAIVEKTGLFEEVPFIIMSIVSNYTPDCLVRAWVECDVEEIGMINGVDPNTFVEKFKAAVRIAEVDPHRATTHNKGIFNGVDALILATGNDFRAVEACGHTYASRNGKYCSLTHAEVKDGRFKFWIDLPMALGTVGGLTVLHPLVKRSLEMLGYPDAKELMEIVACAGLAQNFAAIKSMVTVGIQQGHMKMHLLNILNHLETTLDEKEEALLYFKDKVVSYTSVRALIAQLRGVELEQ